MVKSFTPYLIPIALSTFTLSHADAPLEEDLTPPPALFSFPTIEEVATTNAETPAPAKSEEKHVASSLHEVNPFTGKIKGRKVRLRVRADLDSQVVKELQKNELLTVVGERGDFWAVEAPKDTKAYVFRSFVLDNVVEGQNVNVRLDPSTDAPIISHLNEGDALPEAIIAAGNHKWLEITPPATTRFYVAKSYIENAGGPEVKIAYDQRKEAAEHMLDTSDALAKAEMKKAFSDVDFDKVVSSYHNLINDYSEFEEVAEQAKEMLAHVQEEYLQKRILHIEEEQALAATEQEEQPSIMATLTDKMRLWEPIEEALYASWANINDNKDRQDYLEEQKLASVEIEGFVEPYSSPVKNKPGDFIIRENDVPVAYVYSTQVNLQDLVGTQVKLVATPRPNHNFAFPAYYVIAAN